MPLPEPPPGLPPDQAPIWHDTLTRLQNLGITQVDPRHLRAYVQAAHQHAYFTQLIDQTAPMTIKDGQPAINPALAPQRTAAKDVARLARTLGLTRLTSTNAPAERVGSPERVDKAAEHWGARWCEEHKRWECTGQRRAGRGQCHKRAMTGLNTCDFHQGRGGKVKHLAAVAQQAGLKAGGLLPGGGLVPENVHPRDALLYQVRYWAGMCQWLDEVVAGLQAGELTWGLVREQETTAGDFPGTTLIRQAGLNTWVQWQERAHRMLAMVCQMALQADVAADLVKLQRAQGLAAFRAFQAGLARLRLEPWQWDLARQVMPQVMRELNAA